MKLSIAQKLLAAFVGLTLLVLTATLGLARWSFEQGFLDYVNALEQTRLERLADDFAAEYASLGNNWDGLSDRRAERLLRDSGPRGRKGGRPPPALGTLPPHERRQGPDARRPAGPGDKALRSDREKSKLRSDQHDDDNRSKRDKRSSRSGGPDGRRPGSPPTALYDVNNTLIAGTSMGPFDSLTIRVPVMVRDEVVGELRSEPRRQLHSTQETAFSRQQLRTSWMIGAVCLVLAFGLSLILSRGLLAPVRRAIASVAQLSGGNYDHRMNEKRSDELGRLADDLDKLGATLEANQSSRRRLLADVSHELRTPLTVLTGEIEALKDGVRPFDRAQLESLDQEVQRLRYLVDDLYQLSVSDLGGLSYTFASVDLARCARELIEGLSHRASEQGIVMSFSDEAKEPSLLVRADVNRIEQLLANLLENSLAYTDAPGQVRVTLSRQANSAVLLIEDSAPGVAASDCERLFEPLFRAEASRSRRTGGAGLGLAICRNIVEAHDGTITASPSALGGLLTKVELPLVAG